MFVQKQKAHASVLDADSKADALGDAAAAAPSGLWSEATFALQTPPAHRDQQWQVSKHVKFMAKIGSQLFHRLQLMLCLIVTNKF